MTGVVVCGGGIENYKYLQKYFKGVRLIIAADSGARHCKNFHVTPDLLVGDFDSVREADYAHYAAAGVEIVQFPAEKDYTDSELAVDIAVKKGCSKVILLGAYGTRLDHSLAAIFLLKVLLDKGIEGILADEHNEVKLINSHITLQREDGVNVSLIPLEGDVTGITTSGLYYPLEDATLKVGASRGVSNKFAQDVAQVTVKEGYLLVIKSRD